MEIKSWLRSATWPLRQFFVRSAVWFKQGVKEASIGVVGVAFVTILAYSVVANVSIITAISTWATVFKDVFGLLSVAVEIVIFGGIARTAVYIKKQERIGKYGLIILSVLVLGAVIVVVSAVPGGFSVPPLT